MLRLSKKFSDVLVHKPETGMGFQVADVELNDGTIHNRVVILASEMIASIGGNSHIPFQESDIRAINVTHEKFTP